MWLWSLSPGHFIMKWLDPLLPSNSISSLEENVIPWRRSPDDDSISNFQWLHSIGLSFSIFSRSALIYKIYSGIIRYRCYGILCKAQTTEMRPTIDWLGEEYGIVWRMALHGHIARKKKRKGLSQTGLTRTHGFGRSQFLDIDWSQILAAYCSSVAEKALAASNTSRRHHTKANTSYIVRTAP